MLLDSNIIIYAAQAAHPELRRFIARHSPLVSKVSYLEVLGYHKLTAMERQHFISFFAAATLLPISDEVIKRAVTLKQTRKMTLGDALIAGTALVYDLTLVTRNTTDFNWINDLRLLDPFASPGIP